MRKAGSVLGTTVGYHSTVFVEHIQKHSIRDDQSAVQEQKKEKKTPIQDKSITQTGRVGRDKNQSRT